MAEEADVTIDARTLRRGRPLSNHCVEGTTQPQQEEEVHMIH